MKFIFLLQLLLHLFFAAKGCTEIRVTTEDGSTVVVGRTMEFFDVQSNITVEPQGYPHTNNLSALIHNCSQKTDKVYEALKTWTNKYSIIQLDAINSDIVSDGMNSAGLSVGVLYFPGFAKYQEVSGKLCNKSAISNIQLPRWILGNFTTVQEVREVLENGSFPLVFEQKVDLGELQTLEVHYSVTDKTGDGIIIEFTDKGRTVHKNTVGVCTNSPPYDFHMINLRNYVELSKYAHEPLHLGEEEFKPIGQGNGLLGTPGDLTPPSRLVRAATLTHFADPVKTNDEAVNLAFHILNTVDIPHGVCTDKGEQDFTNWLVVKDLTHNALYYRTYNDLTVCVIYLDKITEPGKMHKLSLASPIKGFKDTTDELKTVDEGHTEL